MGKIVGIRFKPAGKVYDFDAGAFVLNPGDSVIVETEKGLGFGTVAVPPKENSSGEKQYKKVYRLATESDFNQLEQNRKREKEAYGYCLECIKKLDLKMKLFAVEATFDGGRLTFFFTAEGRVDFRQLVKMLVKAYRTRIEMRQVGIRNQAKMCGGIGRCGRQICCSAFMEKFEPVSIRMAKEQNLSLNPTKISGQCGRLMCCLNFENKTYKEMKEKFPKIGKTVTTAEGKGKVIRQNVFSDQITVKMEDGAIAEMEINEVMKKQKKRKQKK